MSAAAVTTDYWRITNEVLGPFIIPIGHPDSDIVQQSAACFKLYHLSDVTFNGRQLGSVFDAIKGGYVITNPSGRHMIVRREEGMNLSGEVVPPGTDGAIPVSSFTSEMIASLNWSTLVAPGILTGLLWAANFVQE